MIYIKFRYSELIDNYFEMVFQKYKLKLWCTLKMSGIQGLFIIGIIYFGTYFTAFVCTSVYCAYIVNKEYTKLSCLNKLIKWLIITWKKKQLYLSLIPHLFDQTTDIAVLY